MTRKLLLPAFLFALATVAALVPFNRSVAAAQGANIPTNGFFAADKAQQGRTVQAAVVLDIPKGLHVNANKPLGKFAIPTSIKIEAPKGISISPVSYPRAVVRRLGFSEESLALYEGRTVMRFNVTVPANFQTGVTELKARVRFQSCTDEVCFPPVIREVKMPIAVVGANESVKRINGEYFRRRG